MQSIDPAHPAKRFDPAVRWTSHPPVEPGFYWVKMHSPLHPAGKPKITVVAAYSTRNPVSGEPNKIRWDGENYDLPFNLIAAWSDLPIAQPVE